MQDNDLTDSAPAVSEADIARFLGHDSIFPVRRHPFYITAPPYVRTSAGIKALHLLCHNLNAVGIPAYMVIYPILYRSDQTNPDWNTPILTQALVDHHFKSGLTPIAIYPETTCGNPLRAPVVMRYVMNYPGLLGGETSYAPDEILYGYSRRLADAVGVPDQVLFMPVSDTSIFHPPASPDAPRSGSCFWAAKYKDYHGAKTFPVTDDSIEITRDLPGSQTPQQIAELFRRSERFYCYENTALAIEAMLCGCPTVFLPNEHFSELIGLDELGLDGFAWGDSPEAVAQARASIPKGRENYILLIDRFWHQLANMANRCAERARLTPYSTCVTLAIANTPQQQSQIAASALRFYRQHGLRSLGDKMVEIIRRDGIGALFRRGVMLLRYFLFRRTQP